MRCLILYKTLLKTSSLYSLLWIDFLYFYSFRCYSHKIGGLNFASKPTQKLSIFVSKIIKFPNQSLSYSLSINPKARCIKSCWPCIDCAHENLLPNYSREYFAEWKPKRKTPFKKFLLLYGEKFPFCSGVFQNSLHLVYI